MIDIGRYNKLEVAKEVEFGVYLYGDEIDEEILLPLKHVPKNCKVGDLLDVFIYMDSEDRIIATTEKPLAQADEFAYLKAVSVTKIGTFMNWGLSKDLLVPFREQKQKMVQGKSYIVYIYVDEKTDRIVASSKIDKWLGSTSEYYKPGQEVDLLIAHQTDLGVNAIINNMHWGVIFNNDLFQPLKTGQRLTGFIKRIRPDNKIDLTLDKPGYEKVDDLSKLILQKLVENNGILKVTDNSEPEVISEMFGASKKTFKKALGALYKQKAIIMSDDGIKIVNEK